jgi:iron(II)-dependent oxidoreductase
MVRTSEIIAMLSDARRRTLDLQSDLSDEQMGVPLLRIINPPIWEVGHVGWFQEKWTLRHLRGEESVRPDADALWDSIAIPHDDRWELPLPSREGTLRYLQDVLDRVIERLPAGEVSETEAYFHWLAVMHEDMHDEAFTYTRQTLGYPAPAFGRPEAGVAGAPLPGDVYIPGGEYLLGARPGPEFVFDNEKWAHPVKVAPFAIARSAVSNGQFAAFVDDGGYRRRELWSEEGWQWREQAGAEHPVYWIPQSNGTWLRRHFDQVVPLGDDDAVIHLNWHEAEAYCRWAGRRLPTEAEWELAAGGMEKRKFPWGEAPPNADRAFLDGRLVGCGPAGALPAGDSPEGCRQMIGNAWEWTSTEFGPYPGFVVDPYKEYSQPWFGPQYRVLRGGCWATRSRLIRNTWRNFYTKDRRDVFGGFRTCAAAA